MNLLSRVFPSPSSDFSGLGIRWAPPAHNKTVMRCGAPCLALNNQRSLCSQAWGHCLRGSVARTLLLWRKHMVEMRTEGAHPFVSAPDQSCLLEPWLFPFLPSQVGSSGSLALISK